MVRFEVATASANHRMVTDFGPTERLRRGSPQSGPGGATFSLPVTTSTAYVPRPRSQRDRGDDSRAHLFGPVTGLTGSDLPLPSGDSNAAGTCCRRDRPLPRRARRTLSAGSRPRAPDLSISTFAACGFRVKARPLLAMATGSSAHGTGGKRTVGVGKAEAYALAPPHQKVTLKPTSAESHSWHCPRGSVSQGRPSPAEGRRAEGRSTSAALTSTFTPVSAALARSSL